MRLTGPENIGPERTRARALGNVPVNSPTRITPENNGKIRPQPDWEKRFARASGGGGGRRSGLAKRRTHVHYPHIYKGFLTFTLLPIAIRRHKVHHFRRAR